MSNENNRITSLGDILDLYHWLWRGIPRFKTIYHYWYCYILDLALNGTASQSSEYEPSKHLLVMKTSSTRLQRNNFTSSKTSWRRLAKTFWKRFEDVLKTSCKTSWKRLQDVLKTSWKTKKWYAEDILKKSWRNVLKASWRHVFKMSWRPLKDFMETKKILTGYICILILG